MDMTCEEFEYVPNKKTSIIILSVTISFFIMTFFLTMLTIISLYQQKKFKLFYTLYALLITPTYIGQFVCFIFSILYLWKASVRQELRFGNIPYWVWMTSILLYGFFCYVMIGVLLYFFADMTFFDFSNKKFYQEPFCSISDLQNLSIFSKNAKKEKRFETLKNLGYQNAKNYRVVFCFLARNSSYHVNKMRVKIETIGRHFKNYHVLLFENDSNDGTREMLQDWASENSKITILDCCSLGNCECKLDWKKATYDGVHSKSRIDKMRMMRQYMLDHVKKDFANWDYSIVMDFDLEGSIFKDGFFTSFAYNQFDVMFASGLTLFPVFFNKYMLYDAWAFLAENDEIDNINKTDIIKDFFHQSKTLFKYPINFQIKKAKSGFNGFAIYKISSIMSASYINKISNSNCEHIDLHLHMIDNGYSKIYFNPCAILFVGQQGEKRIKYLKGIFTKK